MKKFLSILFCICLIISSLSLCVSATELTSDFCLYVSPNPVENGDGTKESPVSLETAKAYLKVNKHKFSSAVVYLAGGEYIITEPLEFTEDDMQNVTYCAYDGSDVVFTGATPITGFEETVVNGVKAFKTTVNVSDKNEIFRTLFSDTHTLTTPRYPEEGYFTVKSPAPEDDLWTEETAPWALTRGNRSFYADSSSIKHDFHNKEDVNVRILHYWHDELMNVTSYDKDSGKIGLSRPSTMLISEGDRYYFENVFEELNQPGEWYLDTTSGELFYIPFEGESASGLTLYSSCIKQLVTLKNTDNITFKGIRFTRTDWEFPIADGYYTGSFEDLNNMDMAQAAIFVDGVITVEYSENVHFTNCEFTDLGGTAIKLREGVKNSSVENCYFENIAATAVYIGGNNCYPHEAPYTSNITVKNNEIYKYGRKFHCAIGIHITYCDTAVIRNNEIHDGYYTGISCGWVWGYDYHATQNIFINRNLIYNIGQGWLSDMGGIYMLGKQRNTTISENVIHNVAADPGEGGYGGWGVYLDEGATFMTVEKNLVYACGNQSFNTHYGEGNVIRNNIGAFSAEGIVSPCSRQEEHSTGYYYNNIFLTKDKAPIYINMTSPETFYDNGNLFWSVTEGDELYFNTGTETLSLKQAQDKGYIHNAIVEAPLFKDALSFDFTLSEDSPAYKMYFEYWDYSVAGTLKDTVIGINREGGTTAYNDNATLQPAVQFEQNTIWNDLKIIVLIPAILLLIFCIITCIIKCNKNYSLPLVTSLVTVILIPLIFDNYLTWNPAVYFPLVFILALFASTLPSRVAYVKEKSKKSVIITFVLNFILSAGIFLGLAGILNLVLEPESPPVISITIVAMIIYILVNTVRILKNTKKERE